MADTQLTDAVWSNDHPLEEALGRLLRQLLTAHAMDDDQIARFCLNPIELAGLLKPDEQMDRAQYAVDGFVEFLEDQGSVRPLAGAMRDWRVTIELLRSRFGWLQLPPVIQKRARLRATELLQTATSQGLIARLPPDRWALTDQGKTQARKTLR